MIYLDNHATTPPDRRVVSKINHALLYGWGNPNSAHHIGDRAYNHISMARDWVALLSGTNPSNVIFTSGATESLNMAIRGTIMSPKKLNRGKVRVAISSIEHDATIATCLALKKRGAIDDLIVLPVDRVGRVDVGHIQNECRKGLDLLCVMAANNEIGTIQPVKEIAAIANRYGVPYLCDASQAIGKIPLSFDDFGITMLVFSGHKIYGIQGIGTLICRPDHSLSPILYGGGGGLRPGTSNLPGIIGLGEACRLRVMEGKRDEKAIAINRDHLQARLKSSVANLIVNGDQSSRLAGNLHISIPYVNARELLSQIGDRVIASTGSACSTLKTKPSHVLTAIGLSPSMIQGSIRLGVGKFNTKTEMDRAAKMIALFAMKQRVESSVGCGCSFR